MNSVILPGELYDSSADYSMGEISGRDVNHNVYEKATTSVNNLPSTAESQPSSNPHPHPKTYFCHLCRKSFTSKANKAKHYKSVHLMERKECGICKKNFSNVYNLKRHIHGAHGAVFDQKTGMIYDQRTNRSQSLSPIPLEGNPLVATNGDGIFPGRSGAKVTFREWDSSPPKLHHEDSTSSSSSDSKLLISIPAAPLGPPDQSFFEAFIPPRYHHIQDGSFKDWITDDDNLNFLSNDNGILQDPDFLRGIGRETHDLKPEESSTSQFPAASFNLQPRLQKAPTPTIRCTKELIPQLQHVPSPSRFTSAPSSHYAPLPERQRGPASRPPKVTSRSLHRSPLDEGEKFAFMNRLGLVRSKAKDLGNGNNNNDNTIDRNILLPLTKEEIASFHRRQDQRIFEKVKTYCHQAAFKESAEGKAERAKLRKKGKMEKERIRRICGRASRKSKRVAGRKGRESPDDESETSQVVRGDNGDAITSFSHGQEILKEVLIFGHKKSVMPPPPNFILTRQRSRSKTK